MFGEVAIKLLKLMGHSGKVPSALLAEDIADARARLESAIKADKLQQSSAEVKNLTDDEAVVTLSQRALPLLDLLRAAENSNSNVMWTTDGT
jgi:hypothetical protein